MKRIHFFWCLIPLAGLLFHYGYGEQLSYAEGAVQLQRTARQFEMDAAFETASERYAAAEKAAHPDDFALRARLRIDGARAMMLGGTPLEAARQLERLLGAPTSGELPRELVAEAKTTLALALYYAAYALRSALPEPNMWRAEIEGARQIFLALYEDAAAKNRVAETAFYAQNLEACILFARTRQPEFVSLPTPPPAKAASLAGIATKRKADSQAE
jgi:hypothetical protein